MMKLGSEQAEIVERIMGGESLIIRGAPGTGKSALLQQVFARTLTVPAEEDLWAPAMVLTPDRRRANEFEAAIGAEVLGSVSAPGGHRLVRSVNSYAYLVISQWLVERAQSRPRPKLVGGAEEDIWFGHWLDESVEQWTNFLPEEVVTSSTLRIDLRNLLARAGEAGLSPDDLKELSLFLNEPLWLLAAQAYAAYAGVETLPFTNETPRIDSARIQIIAARTLLQWEKKASAEGVYAQRPVPSVAFIDDLQDCTPATLDLIRALAACGTQVVGSSCAVAATAGYRGGEPELGSWIARALQIKMPVLQQQWRSTAPIVKVTEAVTGWVNPSKNRLETPHKDENGKEGVKPEVIVTSGEGQRGSYVADAIRNQHYLRGIEWSQIGVIVRNSREIEGLRVQLRRKGVPLAPTNRATKLTQEPVCSALLRLLAFQTDTNQDNTELSNGELPNAELNNTELNNTELNKIEQIKEERTKLALDVATSPLVSIDRLELYRFLRSLGDTAESETADLAYWFDHPDRMESHIQNLDASPESSVVKQVAKAADLWNLAGTVALQPPGEGLWALWSASGQAQVWQERALRGGREGEIADERLDAVIALFRRADLWEQKINQEGRGHRATAREFAAELLQETVEVDSIADTGWRSPGVEILTVSQAAGRQWEVVCLVGLQDGQWPTILRPGGVLNVPRLTSIIKTLHRDGWNQAIPIDEYLTDPGISTPLEFRTLRHERRLSEARLLAVAVSRARKDLLFFTVENEEATASPFLDYLVKEGVVPAFRDKDGNAAPTRELGGLDLSSFVGMMRYSTVDPKLPDVDRKNAARMLAIMSHVGLPSANPAFWSGAGDITSDDQIVQVKDLWLHPSRLSTARDCMLSWFFSATYAGNQRGLFEPAGLDHATVGTLIHQIAEEHPHASGQELREILDQQWTELGLDDGTWWAQTEKSRSDEMVQVLGQYFSTHSGKVETEVEFSAQIGEATVGGRIDRLEHLDDDSIRILDIKTRQKAPTFKDVENDLQLGSYQLALRQEYEIAAAGLLMIGKPSRKGPLRSQTTLDDEGARELTQQLADLAEEMVGPRYGPSPGKHCRYCAFVTSCPAQEKGGRAVE